MIKKWRSLKGIIASLTFSVVIIMVLVCPLKAEEPCLNLIHDKDKSENSEYLFDLKNDQDKNGRSFSCGPEIRASEARKALEAFRCGVLYHDESKINSVLKFPLTIRVSKTLEVNEKPEIVKITNYDGWALFQKERLDKYHLAMIACSNLGNVNVENGRSPGFMIGFGTIWFQRFIGSPKVWVTTINLGPVDKEFLLKSCVP